jgi:hypothetical protein
MPVDPQSEDDLQTFTGLNRQFASMVEHQQLNAIGRIST